MILFLTSAPTLSSSDISLGLGSSFMGSGDESDVESSNFISLSPSESRKKTFIQGIFLMGGGGGHFSFSFSLHESLARLRQFLVAQKDTTENEDITGPVK